MKANNKSPKSHEKAQLILEIDENTKFEVDFNFNEDLDHIIDEATKNLELSQSKKNKIRQKIQNSIENIKREKLEKVKKNKETRLNNINRLFYKSIAREKKKEEFLSNLKKEKEAIDMEKQCTFSPIIIYSPDLAQKKILFQKTNELPSKYAEPCSKERQQYRRIASELIYRELNKPKKFTYDFQLKKQTNPNKEAKDRFGKKEYVSKIKSFQNKEKKKDLEIDENDYKDLAAVTTKDTKENISLHYLNSDESIRKSNTFSVAKNPVNQKSLKVKKKNMDFTKYSLKKESMKQFNLLSYKTHLKRMKDKYYDKIKEGNVPNSLTNISNVSDKDKNFLQRLSYSSKLKHQAKKSSIIDNNNNTSRINVDSLKPNNKNSRSFNINFSNSKIQQSLNISKTSNNRKKSFDYNYIKKRKNMRYFKQENDLLSSYESVNARKDEIKEINSLRFRHNLDKFKLNNLKEIFEILYKNCYNNDEIMNVEEYGFSVNFEEKLIIPVLQKIKDENLEFNFQNFYLIANEIMNKI